ncbi:MAG: hypothetical protein ABRQ39_26435 [Candidatus Eremiobacterota bacterium]
MRCKVLIITVLVLLCSIVTLLPSVTEELTGDYIKPEMVLIEGFTFEMAGNKTGEGRSFYMGKYEVTNQEYCMFLNSMGYAPDKKLGQVLIYY